MKTRRNHRKTTTGRRKSHVKHRVQTRINHRKGTVSSGRRDKFFKRGGATQDEIINKILKDIEPSVKLVIGDITLTTDNVYDKPNNETIDTPIEMFVNNTRIKFVIVKPTSESIKQSVYIYVYNPETINYKLQKKIMIISGKDNMGSYYPDVATAIFDALKKRP
jgi:hypothetical protein